MRFVILLAVVPLLAQQASCPPALDYAFFRDQVQPIFLKKRPGHARCIVCHEHGSPPLQSLKAGATFWTEEQSRKNFEMWKLFVKAGNPSASRADASTRGQERRRPFSCGRQKHWQSQDDPEWRIPARWVNGEKTDASSK